MVLCGRTIMTVNIVYKQTCQQRVSCAVDGIAGNLLEY